MDFNPLAPELACADYDVSLTFYVDVLGFKVVYRREGFAYLEREGAQLMLEQDKGNWQIAPRDYPYGRGVNFQIAVGDVEALHDRVVADGHEIFMPLEVCWHRMDDVELGERHFVIHDPSGYLLRFMQSVGQRPAPS